MNKLFYILIFTFVTSVTAYSQSTVLTGGNNFSVGLCGNGAVYAWGYNGSGQIGQGVTSATSYTSPTKVLGFPAGLNFLQVNAGSGAHALALDCHGQVWVWGENVCGQAGDGSAQSYAGCTSGTATVGHPTPTRAVIGTQTPGTGSNATYLHSIKLIGGGNNFSIAVDSSGNVWTWGENQYGELGDGGAVGNLRSTPAQVVKCAGGNLTNITFVQGGDQTAYALDATGKVWAWGLNDNNNLANGIAGTTAAGNSNCAAQVYKGPSTVAASEPPGTANAPTVLGLTPLTGIKQIAAGDTHGMALDSSGQVWTWGGDWAPGQLGQGVGYIPNAFASRVVAPVPPGAYTASTNGYASPYGGCTGCTYLTGATFIAGGQASSAVVANGQVYTFGGLGLYPAATTCGGTATTGYLLFSGTLGAGIPSTGGVCQPNTTICTSFNPATDATTPAQPGCSGYGVPIPVQTSAGVDLKNIVSIARADAWYFATSNTGQVYTWGFNGGGTAVGATAPAVSSSAGAGGTNGISFVGGELGLGDYQDRAFATKVTLPGGCSIATPCPDKPDLGNNFSVCPADSFTLNAGESQLGYTYTWSYSTTKAGPYTPLTAKPRAGGVGDSSLTAALTTTALYYQVEVQYTGAACACTTQYDTVLVSPNVPTWTGSGTYCTTGGNTADVTFTIGGSTDGFKWYTASTGGTVAGTGLSLTVAKTATVSEGATCPYALFVEDTSQFPGALLPTGDTPGTSAPCSGTSSTNNGAGTNGDLTMLVVTQSLTITSVQFTQTTADGASGTASFVIYDNTGSMYCPGCNPAQNYSSPGVLKYTSPATAVAAAGNTVQTLPGSYTLAPGTYWIGLSATGTGWLAYTCTTHPPYTAGTNEWSTPYWDNTGNNVLKAAGAVHQNQQQGAGAIFNIKFSVGSPYDCTRLLVCAVDGSCPSPVKFLAFTAEQQSSGVELNWSTASEQNSSYFSVERSTDGVNFTNVGKVTAAGNSSVIQNYSLTDNSAGDLTGTIYYRIVEYDVNNATTISSIQAVNTGKGQEVKIIPNPNNGNFEVIIQGEAGALDLTLYNAVGQIVYTSSGKAEGSTFSKNINIQSLSTGVYYLNINSPSNTWVRKVVKE